jgi:hypothetical protein
MHTLIRPEAVTPRTPTELLEQILARDDTPTSATTLLRRLSDPAATDQHSCRQLRPNGNNISIEASPTPATTPANLEFRRQGVGSTFEGGRHEDRHHRQRQSEINQRSRPPGPSF